jgi:hypothetical protein
MKRSMMISYVVVCAAVLIFVLAKYDGTRNSDIEEVLIWLMGVLTVPSCFLAIGINVLFAILYEHVTGSVLATSSVQLVCSWAVFAVCGWMQWFVLIPRLVRRIRPIAMGSRNAP